MDDQLNENGAGTLVCYKCGHKIRHDEKYQTSIFTGACCQKCVEKLAKPEEEEKP